MSEERKCFTFVWKIKNFNFLFESREEIYSPLFSVPINGETQWQLLIYPYSLSFRNCVACYIIERERNDSSPKHLNLDYELSFVAFDGSVLQSTKYADRVNKENSIWALHVTRDEFLLKKDVLMPDDILTICCRMWDVQKSMTQSGSCFAETKIATDCIYFVGTIEEFSCVEPREKYPIRVKSSSTENVLFSMSLHVASDGKLTIEMTPALSVPFSHYKCVIFVLDVIGNKMKSGKGEFFDTESQVSFPLTLQKEYLIENKGYYFPNNVLTIELEITFRNGKLIESIDDTKYGFHYESIQEMISNTFAMKLKSEEYHSEKLTTLKDDLNLLFMEGVLCDTKLKTPTQAFSVHKSVLSARSPVFKSMFTSDMREKANNCVDIDDLNADTVHRMLKFMYLDTLDELDYESAKNLYFAADKYSIVSLKFGCVNFLKENILPSNCCDILLLADKHQDKNLKNVVQDYIAKNDNAVLFSDQWKDFEKNHPHLAIEVLRTVYIRNRKP